MTLPPSSAVAEQPKPGDPWPDRDPLSPRRRYEAMYLLRGQVTHLVEPSTYAPGGDVTTQATGVDLIAVERQRQIDVEGYTPQHDREHDNDALAWAAACYAAPATIYRVENRQVGNQNEHLVRYWEPWPAHWKRGNYDNGFRFEDDRVRNLVKAGALIAAEIDRLNAKQSDDNAQAGER